MRYLFVLLLAGCGLVEVRLDVNPNAGTNFSIEHGIWQFSEAMAAAETHCVKLGLSAKHLGSDRAGGVISRFECVPT